MDTFSCEVICVRNQVNASGQLGSELGYDSHDWLLESQCVGVANMTEWAHSGTTFSKEEGGGVEMVIGHQIELRHLATTWNVEGGKRLHEGMRVAPSVGRFSKNVTNVCPCF